MRKARTLVHLVVLRIGLFAGLAMTVQAVVIFADYYFDNARLANLMVEHETERLSRGISQESAGSHFALPDGLKRYSLPDRSYLARIRTSGGEVLYTNCRTDCGQHLLPPEVNPPDFWYRMISAGKPITVVGGRTFGSADRKLIVEVAILDDEQRVMWDVLAREFADHLAVPMSILLLFVLGGTVFSIVLALRPVRRAAGQAENIDPLDPTHTVDTSGMPREIADFGQAINRTLSRIRGLMTAQQVFTTAVAHEIRTPLAMLKLELGNIDHPRPARWRQMSTASPISSSRLLRWAGSRPPTGLSCTPSTSPLLRANRFRILRRSSMTAGRRLPLSTRVQIPPRPIHHSSKTRSATWSKMRSGTRLPERSSKL